MTIKYLPIIVQHFETLQKINNPAITIVQKKKNFQEFLLEHFKKEKKVLISDPDFLNSCRQEVEYLKIKIISLINEEKGGILRSYIAKNKLLGTTVQDFDLIKSKEEEIENLYGNHTPVDITTVVRTARKEMCFNDIVFIESVFETINFMEPQQTEAELLDFSDNEPLQKIAFLYESGIINFLYTKDSKPHKIYSVASLLSGITGLKPNTVHSAIYPLLTPDAKGKGAPAKKALEKAKHRVVDLGF